MSGFVFTILVTLLKELLVNSLSLYNFKTPLLFSKTIYWLPLISTKSPDFILIFKVLDVLVSDSTLKSEYLVFSFLISDNPKILSCLVESVLL